MRVLTKCDGPVSAFEVYQVVAEELSRIPLKDSLLTEDQLRRKFCYLAVLEQIERHSAVPSIEQLDVTTEGKNALEFHAAGATASTIVSKQNLEALLDKLNSDFGLSQSELLQITDLAPIELVDFYAMIEDCGTRFEESQVAEMLKATREVFLNPLESAQI